MKKRLACKTIFFLALALCISISFLSCSNQRKMSAEEKVLETWNAFFKNVIQNENPIEENLSVATVQSVDSTINTPPRIIQHLENLKTTLLEYKTSDFYVIELDGSLSKTAQCIDDALFQIENVINAFQNNDKTKFEFSMRNLCACMNDFQFFTIENSKSYFIPFVELLSIISFLSIIFVVAGTFYLKNKKKIEELTEQNIHEKLITKTIVDVQESERTRISRELHDTVTQDSRIALLYVNKLEQLFIEEKDAKKSGKDFCKDKALVESEELILKIKTLETQNLLNIRNIIRNMTPPEIENADFVNLLNEFAVNSAKFSDIPCKFYAEKSELFKKLSGTQKLHIFRIIQEAVTNAEKHSGAEEISIFARTEIFSSDDEKSRKQILVFIVSDDGKGMDENFFLQNTHNKFESHTANSKISITEQSTHLGLKGILSRAEIIGGTVEIKSSAEIGTTIILKVDC